MENGGHITPFMWNPKPRGNLSILATVRKVTNAEVKITRSWQRDTWRMLIENEDAQCPSDSIHDMALTRLLEIMNIVGSVVVKLQW